MLKSSTNYNLKWVQFPSKTGFYLYEAKQFQSLDFETPCTSMNAIRIYPMQRSLWLFLVSFHVIFVTNRHAKVKTNIN